jgi:hypothetical protein
MNAYYTNTNIRRFERNDSDSIRKAYLANTRKREFLSLIGSLAESIDSKTLWSFILTLKIVSGIICVIGFLAVVSLIEAGTLSIASGFIATAIIAAVECLCFVPIKKQNNNK